MPLARFLAASGQIGLMAIQTVEEGSVKPGQVLNICSFRPLRGLVADPLRKKLAEELLLQNVNKVATFSKLVAGAVKEQWVLFHFHAGNPFLHKDNGMPLPLIVGMPAIARVLDGLG